MSTELEHPSARRVRSTYTLDDIELGLRMIALCAGNVRHASKRLAAQGTHVPFKTLHNWATIQHADRYQQIRHDEQGAVATRTATRLEDLTADIIDTHDAALKLAKQQLADGDVKDAAGAMRNLSTSVGILNQNAQLLRGQPTHIVEKRDTSDILRALAHKLGSVDTTAEELGDTDTPTDGVV